jgi:dipeptidyl aminopeptidase/acylaminoacyl peptidase
MRQPPPSLHDLDALFAPPTAEEIAEAWASLATDFGAGPLELLGEPIQEDGVTAQFFHYASAGLKVYGALYRPSDTAAGPYPLLLANHGGGGGLGPLRATPAPGADGTSPPTRRRPFPTWCWELAQAGYVVLASAYRGEPSPVGMSEGRLELRKGEVDDVLQLLACGEALPYVDGGRIGMWGNSHGAVITALAVQRSPELRAGLCFYPAIDVIFRGPAPNRSTRQYLEALLSGQTPQRMITHGIFQPWLEGRRTLRQTRQEMIVRTAHLFADRTQCPVFVVCGDADPLCDQAVTLDIALARAHKEHEFRIFPKEDHGFNHNGSPEATAEAWGLTLDFFARRLHRGVS